MNKTTAEINLQFDIIVPPRKFNSTNFTELRTGDILFHTGEYLFSKGTQLLSDSIWNHVGIVVNMNELMRSNVFGNGVPEKDGNFQIRNHSPFFILESVIPNGIRLLNFSKAGYRYEKGEPYKGRIAVTRLKIARPADYLQRFRDYMFSASGERYGNEDLGSFAFDSFLQTYTNRQIQITPNPIPPFVCTELIYYLTQYTLNYNLKTKDNLLLPSHFSEDPNIEFLGEMIFDIL